MSTSLIRSVRNEIPAFSCVKYAKGHDIFMFKAKTMEKCWKLYDLFLKTVPDTKYVRARSIGLRPDYPVPVARYFIEVVVDSEPAKGFLNLWTTENKGLLSE